MNNLTAEVEQQWIYLSSNPSRVCYHTFLAEVLQITSDLSIIRR